MKHLLIGIAALAGLSACNRAGEVEATNASTEEVARKVQQAGAAGTFVNPGRWVSKVTIEEMSMPGMPAGAAAQIQGMKGHIQTQESCLTPDQVQRPKEDFFAGENKNCRYDRFTMGKGKIDAQMTCQADKGDAVMKMTMAGTYSGDAYQMQMGMTSDAGDALGEGMAMKMRVEANSVGECSAKQG